MLTDGDIADIMFFIGDVLLDARTGKEDRVALAGICIARTVTFIIEHPDMCAAELDDFFRDNKAVDQAYNRHIKPNSPNAESQ